MISAEELGADDEQSREERLEIARRYRERRGRELRELAAPHVEGEIRAVGEFGTVPTEALAAIPGLGMLLLPLARRRSRRLGLTPKLLLALTDERLHALTCEPTGLRRDGIDVKPARSWARSEVEVLPLRRVFMREEVRLELPGSEQPLKLYAPPLRTNPWSAEVVRGLGGNAPDPLDLSA